MGHGSFEDEGKRAKWQDLEARLSKAFVEEQKKLERLAKEWPKRCGCGRVHLRANEVGESEGLAFHTGAGWWNDLPLAVTSNAPDGRYTDAFATHEMRHCHCGSTLMVAVQIHDLDEE